MDFQFYQLFLNDRDDASRIDFFIINGSQTWLPFHYIQQSNSFSLSCSQPSNSCLGIRIVLLLCTASTFPFLIHLCTVAGFTPAKLMLHLLSDKHRFRYICYDHLVPEPLFYKLQSCDYLHPSLSLVFRPIRYDNRPGCHTIIKLLFVTLFDHQTQWFSESLTDSEDHIR